MIPCLPPFLYINDCFGGAGREAQQKLVVQIIHWSLGLGLPSCAKFKSHVPGCFHWQGMPVRSTVSRSSFFSSFSIHKNREQKIKL